MQSFKWAVFLLYKKHHKLDKFMVLSLHYANGSGGSIPSTGSPLTVSQI